VVNETVTASSQFDQKTIAGQYTFENCYDATMDASDILVCKKGVVNQKFNFINKGTETQKFDLSIDSNWLYFTQSEVLVGGGDTKSVTLVGLVPEEYSNTQTIVAESKAGKLSKTVSVITLPNEECNDMNFTMPLNVDANCCDGTIVPLIVTNTGYFEQQIKVDSVAPPWVTMSEEGLSLLPKQSKVLYVYVAPPAGTEGNYNATITISNDANITKEINFNVNVAGTNCKLVVGGDVNVNSNVSETKVFTRQEVTVDFVVSNDSNVGFNVNNITIKDLNATVDFNKGVFLMPGQKIVAKLSAKFAEGEVVSDRNVTVLIETSAGNFEKNEIVSFASPNGAGASITGWFSAYSVPVVGLLLIVLLALVVLALMSKKSTASARKPKFKK
jgi:uncharacterized membrane protein